MKPDFCLAEIKPESHHVTPYTGFKGDVTRDDSQRRFLAQRSVATTLLRHCFEWLQHCSTIATLCCAKNRRCESSRATFTFRHLLQNKFALAGKFATCTDSVANSKLNNFLQAAMPQNKLNAFVASFIVTLANKALIKGATASF